MANLRFVALPCQKKRSAEDRMEVLYFSFWSVISSIASHLTQTSTQALCLASNMSVVSCKNMDINSLLEEGKRVLPFSESTLSTALFAVLVIGLQSVQSCAVEEFWTAVRGSENVKREIDIGAKISNLSPLPISKSANSLRIEESFSWIQAAWFSKMLPFNRF